MTEGPRGALAALLQSGADELEAVERQTKGTSDEWSTNGLVFAAVDGDRAEFRLVPAVVAAALRTPDTATSARGPDWVAFAPATLDGHAMDRAAAWMASAWRRARAGD